MPRAFVLLCLAGFLSAILSSRTHPSSFSACLQLSLLFCLLSAIIQLKRAAQVLSAATDAHCRPSLEESNTRAIRRAARLLCQEAQRRDSDMRPVFLKPEHVYLRSLENSSLGGSLSAASTGSRPSHARQQFPWRPISLPAAAAGTAENKAEPR